MSRSDIRNAADGQKSLQRTILRIAAMHHGENHVYMSRDPCMICLHDKQRFFTEVGRKHGGICMRFVCKPCVFRNAFDLSVVIQPASVFGDTQHHHVIASTVNLLQNRGYTHQRYLIFRRFSTEHATYRSFFSLTHLMFFHISFLRLPVCLRRLLHLLPATL